ncbi:hypothetical protein BJD62_gp33 [Gordonia phage Lucky10]|uniref:Uncharacterized protein n=1 Tax=Gordonia phage Lucky10 TaxID=1821557 RepID=A0A142KAZ3_9CAUD|nr:hypothetical protein BJD62_gp33 [Gordonia phage Lucky10]AMS03276.1 hypothetical protein SEA_LUCKY10_33 [Gordonia phage Lucky10]
MSRSAQPHPFSLGSDFKVGDRVTWTAELPDGAIEMAGKIVDHSAWAPLFSHWVRVTHGEQYIDTWAAHEFNLEPGALSGLLYLFDEQMEHLD